MKIGSYWLENALGFLLVTSLWQMTIESGNGPIVSGESGRCYARPTLEATIEKGAEFTSSLVNDTDPTVAERPIRTRNSVAECFRIFRGFLYEIGFFCYLINIVVICSINWIYFKSVLFFTSHKNFVFVKIFVFMTQIWDFYKNIDVKQTNVDLCISAFQQSITFLWI